MDEHKLKLVFETIKKGNALEESAREAAKLENAIRDLRQELDKSERAFEATKSISISLRAEYKKMAREGDATTEMLQAQSKAIEKAAAAELEAIRATQKLVSEIDELGDESGIAAGDLAQLSDRLQESEKWVTGVGGAAKRASDDTRALAGEVTQLGNKTDETNQSLGRLDDKADQANQSLNRMGDGVEDAGRSLDKIEGKVGATAYAMGNILADGIQDAAQAMVDFTKQSYEGFRSFDDETRRVFAQVPDLSATMRDSLAGDAKVIAAEIGRMPEETLPALRKALNLGISEGNLLSSIETASKAARIGNESLIDTMVLGQSVVNAYGGELYTLTDTYDQLNYITQNSNLEFGDLNANMNQIISAAAEAGVGLDSVAGAMITMNRQGDSAAEIGDLLSNVLTQISIEGTALGMSFKEAAGVGFREFTAAGGTLSEGLQILSEHADATGQDLLNMVGGSSAFYRDIQAARGVLELTGRHADELATNTQKAAEATGSLAAAYKEFENSPAMTYDQAAASVANLKLAWGQFVAKVLTDTDLLKNATIVANAAAGTLDNQIGKDTGEIAAQAAATQDYAAALSSLSKGYEAAGTAGRIFGLTDYITFDTENVIRDMARTSSSYEDFVAKLKGTSAELFDFSGRDIGQLNGFQFEVKDLFVEEMKRSGEELVNTAADIQQQYGATWGNSMELFYANAAQATTSTREFADAQVYSTTVSIGAALQTRMQAEELGRLAEQQQWATDNTIGYFDQLATGQGETADYNQIAYETGIQYATTAEDALTLAIATGTLTREQALAKYEMAANQSAAAEYGRQLAEGTITAKEFQNALAILVDQSPYEADVEVETGDAVDRLGAIDAKLTAINGRHTTSRHTHTEETIRRDSTDSSGGDNKSDYKGDDKREPANQYSGGPMWPGQAYLVGDTASGHTTPYSEIIVPQQPMFNLGVQGSKDLLGGGDTYYLEINAPGANVYEIEQAVNRVLAASGRQAEARMRA